MHLDIRGVLLVLASAWAGSACGDVVGVDFSAVHLADTTPDASMGSSPDGSRPRDNDAATGKSDGAKKSPDAGDSKHDAGSGPKCNAKTCEGLGASCGAQDDGCGGVLQCGSCVGSGACIAGNCQCQPATCPSLKATCGMQDDGCGKPLDCGSCLATQNCADSSCACVPTTCTKAGANCGTLPDGCGNMLSCGACTAGNECGGGGPNKCGLIPCVPTTCAAANANCGDISNGCGAQLDCGTCTAPESCGGAGTANVCGCTPTTCATLGRNCDDVANGCGGMLDCGTCTAPDTCAGGGTANVCGCTPTSCAALGYACGAPSNNCGGTLDCGTCTSPDECLSGVCTCIPRTCDGILCGTLPNGCGGDIYCGVCDPCFGAGTDITMADGSHRAIETVKVGDAVRSYDPLKDAWVSATVTRTFVHPPERGTGTFIVVNRSLRLTSNHPVWVDGQSKRADQLVVGDSIVALGQTGRPEHTRVATLERITQREVTYDLDVDGPHDFVAGLIVVNHKEEP